MFPIIGLSQLSVYPLPTITPDNREQTVIMKDNVVPVHAMQACDSWGGTDLSSDLDGDER
jgi:hypothetical protein